MPSRVNAPSLLNLLNQSASELAGGTRMGMRVGMRTPPVPILIPLCYATSYPSLVSSYLWLAEKGSHDFVPILIPLLALPLPLLTPTLGHLLPLIIWERVTWSYTHHYRHQGGGGQAGVRGWVWGWVRGQNSSLLVAIASELNALETSHIVFIQPIDLRQFDLGQASQRLSKLYSQVTSFGLITLHVQKKSISTYRYRYSQVKRESFSNRSTKPH